MTQFYIQLTVLCIQFYALAYCPEVPPLDRRETLERTIYEISPHTALAVARPLSTYIDLFCDRRDHLDALAVVWIESGFKPNAKSHTQDHGLFQLNEVHGPVHEWTPAERTAFACERIRWAKERGDLAYYHSKTPSHRRAYRSKLRKAKMYVNIHYAKFAPNNTGDL